MKNWMIAVTAACLFLSVMGLFMSEGKTKKYLSGILRVVVIFFVFEPILLFFIEKDDSVLSLTTDATQTVKEDNDEFFVRLCETELNKNGIQCVLRTEKESGKIKYVDVYLEETVISEEEGNIYKNSKTVIDAVEKYLAVERERIRVWGK